MRAAGLALLMLAVGAGFAPAEIHIEFDYTYDDGFFGGHPDRQAALEYAAACLCRFADDLSAIQPSGSNTWDAYLYRPDTGDAVYVPNLVVPADTLIVFAGGRDLAGALGVGGPGGWSGTGTGAWLDTIEYRGEAGAWANPPTDQGPWGGQVSFDSVPTYPWYFGIDPAGLPSGHADFVSTAMHELGHVLGFGIVGSTDMTAWDTYFTPTGFSGPAAVAEYGGNVPLDAYRAHWYEGTMSTVDGVSQETAMDPTVLIGSRKWFTDLDWAGLDDIGWDVAAAETVWDGSSTTAWGAGTNWSTTVSPGPSATAVFDTAAPRQPALAGDGSARGIEFLSTGWTVGGMGTLTVYDRGVAAGAGTNTIAAPVALGMPSTWTVAGGGTLAVSGGLDGGGFVLTKQGAGTLEVTEFANLAGLHVQAGTVRLSAAGANVRPPDDLVINTAAGAAVDLTVNNLIVDYTTPPTPGGYSAEFLAVEALVASGFQDGPGGYWDGPGIQSSAAAGTADHATALAVFDNAGPGGGKADLEGEPVDATSVLVKYAWFGDINLDGVVDFNDYNIIDNTFLGGDTANQHWQRGDLNYDTVVDFNDYNLIDNTYLAHAGETLAVSAPPSPTPEPATVALVCLGAAGLLLRRRSR